MVFDFSKLRGRIRECFGSEKAFAVAMAMSPSNLSARLNGKIQFGGEEIKRASILLKIPDEEIGTYFFKQKFDFAEQ